MPAALDRINCARCGTRLGGSYRTHLVAATEHLLEMAPDGSGFSAVLAAASACSWNCLTVLAAQRAIAEGGTADAAVQAVAERERQVTTEGWSPEHDDQHTPGQLASAGAMYALNATVDRPGAGPMELRTMPAEGEDAYCWLWPWDAEWWKPKDELRDLVRAAALVAAEGDRIVRERRRRDQQDPF